jgi:transcriptional regulator with XRE-family HTH domain
MPAGVDPLYARQIGQAIATVRRARGMTQEDLRLGVGNSKNAVSNWERGVSVPTLQNLRELCRVLRVPPERLMGLNGAARRERRAQVAVDAEALAGSLGTLRRTAERAAPDLIGALREAEREARRISAAG